MKLFLCTLINLSCEELNSEPENPLKYAISNQKLVYAQLLAWVSFCPCYSNKIKVKLLTVQNIFLLMIPIAALSYILLNKTLLLDKSNKKNLTF